MKSRTKKEMKKILSLMIMVCMILAFVSVERGIVSQTEVQAATFDDINQSSVFLKQAKGSVTCTLVSAAMLLRRAAMMNGNSNWNAITESSMESTAWINGQGLRHSFTYAGITVSYGSDLGGSSEKLISMLRSHPEGIVIYNRSMPHAILVTDYSDGVFYCADPSPYYPSGRIAISQASFNVGSATSYWYVSSPNLSLTTNYDPLTVPTITTNKEWYNIGETAQISWEKSGTNTNFYQYWLIIKNCDTNEQIFGGATGNANDVNANKCSIKLPTAGQYMITVYAVPHANKDTLQKVSTKYINVGTPESLRAPTITTNKSFYNIGETARISWEKSSKKSNFYQYWLIVKNCTTNKEVYGGDAGSSYNPNVNSFNLQLSEEGIYMITVYAVPNADKNTNQKVCTKYITVGENELISAIPSVIKKYDNTLISVFDITTTWDIMNEFAKSMQSQLVNINDEKKNNVIHELIKSKDKAQYYMGLYRLSSSSPWKWMNETFCSYANWNEGEPNCTNNSEFYASIIKESGLWNDVSEYSNDSGFIIETPLDLKETACLENNDKIYKFYNIDLPYSLAKMFCEENGGTLVCIESENENTLIAKKAKELGYIYYIGANDLSVEGEFKWVNGEDVTYSNWRSGEPNNNSVIGEEDYVYMYTDGTWNDAPGQEKGVGFIAEFDKTPVPSVPSEIPSEAPSVSPSTSPSAPPSVSPSTSPSVPPSEIPSETPNQDTIKGDVNMDKKVDLSDAQLTLKAALKILNLEANQVQVADVDGNGKIELADAQKILKAALKIEAL